MLERCGEWIGSLVEFPGFVNDEGAPYRPTVVLWYEPETQWVVDSELVRPEHALMRAAGLFHLATREPKAGTPRIPRRVRVSDRALATALAGSIGDVEIVVAETPEVDEVVESMREHLRRRDRRADEHDTETRRRGYLGGGVDAATMGRFFAAAASFYDAAPWEVIPPDEMLGLRCKALGLEDGVAIVVGQLGQSYGVSIYFSAEDADKMLVVSQEAQRIGRIPRDGSLPERHIMVSFDSREELSREEIAEVERHDWDVFDDDAYPRAAIIEYDLASRTLTDDELAGVSAVLMAIAITAAESREELAGAFEGGPPIGRPFAICMEHDVEIEVDIAAPGGASRPEDPLRADRFTVATAEELRRALLIYSAGLAGALDAELESREADVLYELVTMAATVYGIPLLRLRPRELTRLVTVEMPQFREFSAADANVVFDLVTRAFALAVRIFDDRAAHGCVRALSPGLRKRFDAALAAQPPKTGTRKRKRGSAPKSTSKSETKSKSDKPAKAAKSRR